MPVRFQNNFAPRTQLGSQLGAAINALFGNIPTAYERELSEARVRNLNADSDLKLWMERNERLRHNYSNPEGLMETALHGVGGTMGTGAAYQDRFYDRVPAAPPAAPAAPMPAPAAAPAGQLASPPPQKLWAPTDSYIAPPDVQVQPIGMESLDFGVPLEGPAGMYGPPMPEGGATPYLSGMNGPELPSGWLPPSLIERANAGMPDPQEQAAQDALIPSIEQILAMPDAASPDAPMMGDAESVDKQRMDSERLSAEAALAPPSIAQLLAMPDPEAPPMDGMGFGSPNRLLPPKAGPAPYIEMEAPLDEKGGHLYDVPVLGAQYPPANGGDVSMRQTLTPMWNFAGRTIKTEYPTNAPQRDTVNAQGVSFADQDFKDKNGTLPESTQETRGDSYWDLTPLDEPTRAEVYETNLQDFRGATHMPDAAAPSGKSASQIAQEAVRMADPSLSDEMSRRLGAMIAALRMGVTTQTTDPRNITSAYTTLQGGPVREDVLAGRMDPGTGGARLAAAEGKKLHSNFAGGSMNDYTGALNAEPSWVAENQAKADNQQSQAGLNKERVNTEKSRQKLMGAQTRYNDQRYRGGPRAGGAAAADDKPMPASEVNAMNKVFAQALEQIEGEQGGKIPAEVKASIMSHAAHLYQTQFRGDTFGAIQEALATLAPEWSQERGWNPFSDDDDRIVPRGGSGGAERKPAAPAASAPAKPAAAVPPRPAGLSDEQIRAQAKQAIDSGADMNEVNARLRAWGVKG